MVDSGGDTPIMLAEYQFTLGDSAFLSRVPDKTIRNWLARGVIAVGKRHFVGRWTFNMLDIIKLTVMYGLMVRLQLPPASAVLLAEAVAQDAWDGTARDHGGKLLSDDGVKPNRNLLVAFDDNGQVVAAWADIKKAGFCYAASAKGSPLLSPEQVEAFRHPHVVIPTTALIHDLILRTEDLARHNEQNEGSGD